MITNLLNVFADTMGSAILSTPPEFLAKSVPDIIKQASGQIFSSLGSRVLAKNKYSCESLGIVCETIFMLHVDSLDKLIGRGNGRS